MPVQVLSFSLKYTLEIAESFIDCSHQDIYGRTGQASRVHGHFQESGTSGRTGFGLPRRRRVKQSQNYFHLVGQGCWHDVSRGVRKIKKICGREKFQFVCDSRRYGRRGMNCDTKGQYKTNIHWDPKLRVFGKFHQVQKAGDKKA